jgi:hypothetical protein
MVRVIGWEVQSNTGDGMYRRVNRSDVLNRMGHVFERFQFMMRTRSLSDEQLENIDNHLSQIIEVLNEN